MDARSLAALNSSAAHPPRVLTRTSASFEGIAVTLYVFRVPGRRDLCLTPSKPLGDVVTDLDVSTALYYLRFDEDPSSSNMTLLRRNPATESTQEVALIVDSASHIDVFAAEYSLIEQTFWKTNGNETMTLRSSFGCTVHHSDSSHFFLSPWTGRCAFLSVKNGHALRCSHTLQIPTEETVDVSELRFNFSGHKIKARHSPIFTLRGQNTSESSHASNQSATTDSSSYDSRRWSTEYSSKRRSILSRSSGSTSAGTSEAHTSKRKSFLLPLQKRLQGRLSSTEEEAVSNVSSVSNSSKQTPFGQGQAATSLGISSGPGVVHNVRHNHAADRSFVSPWEEEQQASKTHSELQVHENTTEAPPQLPPRRLMGPRPLTTSYESQGGPTPGSSRLSGHPGDLPSSVTAIKRRPLPSVANEIAQGNLSEEFGVVSMPTTSLSIRRKPVRSRSNYGAINQSGGRSAQASASGNLEYPSSHEIRTVGQSVPQTQKVEAFRSQPQPSEPLRFDHGAWRSGPVVLRVVEAVGQQTQPLEASYVEDEEWCPRSAVRRVGQTEQIGQHPATRVDEDHDSHDIDHRRSRKPQNPTPGGMSQRKAPHSKNQKASHSAQWQYSHAAQSQQSASEELSQLRVSDGESGDEREIWRIPSVTEKEASSRLDLSLGQEKLGGGSDGEQAKLGKLIIWSEGQKMLDLIVSANMMMFYRAYRAANAANEEA